MNGQMVIVCGNTAEMIEVVAGLVKEGLTFKVMPVSQDGGWIITLTGGY